MSDPYASHLPVLRMVLALSQPEQVLELGAGNYSTRAFLDCPTLKRLLSIETDPAWVNRIQDERLTMRLADDTVEALPRDLTQFDLVFIDNADNAADRERTIRAVLSQPHPPAIVHDADYPAYLASINELSENVVVFTEDYPWTAVVW